MNWHRIDRTIHRYSFAAMGCPCEMHLETPDAALAQAAAEAARAEVERLDRKYSHFRGDSLVARIGACADTGSVIELDNETSDLIDFATVLHRQSGGMFDITAGAFTRIWDLRSGRIPSAAQLQCARRQCGWNRVSWERPRLRLHRPGMRLDLGGVVKEYAADRAARICKQQRVASGIIDLGGDISVVGPHANGAAWVIGIKSPNATAQAFAHVELMQGGLATSGDYERVMVIADRRYSHIIDPISGYPVESYASVSVVADSCLVAGGASTTAMLLGCNSGHRWLQSLGLPFLCVDANGENSGTLPSGC